MSLLETIENPETLRMLDEKQLDQVSDELRQYIMDVISVEGGHFGGNLGVVELTVALHYVFNTPKDKLIWDIGHQGYPHKVLTGRRDQLNTIRKTNGLSPFLKITESVYDHFGAGHTATSLSAALGIATARDLNNEDHHVVAVIGDGAMTGGLPFEALNNIGDHKRNLIIVLNDNSMSIDPNCGSICTHFNDLAKSKADHNIFEALGVKYHGPINGHNMKDVLSALKQAKSFNGPQLIHLRTIKGNKWPDAEESYTRSHAISSKSENTAPKFNAIYGKVLTELGEVNKNLVAVTPAMASGSGMLEFAKKFPDRFFDVGIAEQHAVTFSAGLAREGKNPFCTIYSTFLQRAYDQVIHDVCIQNLPVKFMIDRGGMVGADGPTHHGVYDLSFLRCIPNMVVAAPRDEKQLETMMDFANHYNEGPIAIRYARGHGKGDNAIQPKEISIGKSEILRNGVDILILAVGPWVYDALEVADELKEHISVKVVDMQFIKPLDEDVLRDSHFIKNWITLEDNAIIGGFGGAVSEWIADNKVDVRLHRLGIPDTFMPHGKVSDLRKIAGCSPEQLKELLLSIKNT